MKEHYGFSDEEYNKLIESGVTIRDLFKAVPLFDPYGSGEPINFTGLLYYIDAKGDFNEPPKLPHKKIATAFFNGLPIKERIAAAEYIDCEH